jgi:ferric enterobactin receptor
MKFFVCLIFFTALYGYGFSQPVKSPGACTIKGRVIDSISGQPMGYTIVTAFLKGNSNLAGGNVSDDLGKFVIDNLIPGEYYIKVESSGYKSTNRAGIVLTDKEHSNNLGDIPLAVDVKYLKEVMVTGNRSFMENHLDKFVYNVEKDVTSQGGVATDILKKVPQVSVDVDGNVELLGSSNVRVFVNGKPSTMFDNNLADALAAIPASQIKSIEVITTPGAQYDAQGTGGIINIVLKDNKSQGINGSVALSGGTRLENGSANIHARKGKLDVSASLSGNAQIKGTTLNSADRHANSDSTLLLQNGQGTLEKNGYRGQLGMDWAISKKQDINASVSFNKLATDNTGFTDQQQFSYYPFADSPIVRNSYNNNTARTIDWNVNYIKKFSREGQELDLSCQSSNMNGSTRYQQSQYDSGSTYVSDGAQGTNTLKDMETYLIADYAQPLSKNSVLNFGVKGSFSRINSYSDHYLLNPGDGLYDFDTSQLNNFNFYRDVYAAYASATFPLFTGYNLKAGVRDEYTNISLPGDSISVPSYNSFIPSIVVSHKFGESQTLKISYAKRIQRAGYRQLNPFIDATDPTNLLQGNPYLRPERSDVAELTYNKFFDKGSSLLVTLFYRSTLDDEQSYILHKDADTVGNTIYKNVTISTNENAGHQQLTGFNISGSLLLSKKLEVRGNANIFDKYIVSELIPGNSINSVNYRINANATYQFSKTLVAEFFGNFNSQRTEIQGKFPSFTTYSFAIRKLLFKNKAGIAFTTTDPFNKYVDQATDITGQNFSVVSDRKIPYRSFGLSFNYKFGKMEYKEKKQEKNDLNNSDESN